MSDGAIEIPLVWVDVDETPIHFANQFAGRVYEGEITLSVGQLSPPVLLGTDEDREQQAANLPFVSIHTIARFGMNKRRARELIQVLTQLLKSEEG